MAYDESIDRVTTSLDAGQGLAGLPDSILAMTSHPQTLINPAALPVDPTSCTPVYPHSYLRVNTLFEVARQHGLRTAWSDKHPAYEILNGPSGTGVQDLFTPEINSSADPSNPDGADWTANNAKTQQYDNYKVQAVLNEIDGYDHSRHVEGRGPERPRPELPGRLHGAEAPDVRRAARRVPRRRGHSRAAARRGAGLRRP